MDVLGRRRVPYGRRPTTMGRTTKPSTHYSLADKDTTGSQLMMIVMMESESSPIGPRILRDLKSEIGGTGR